MKVLAYAEDRSWAGQIKSLSDSINSEAAVFSPGRELAEKISGLYGEIYYSDLGPFDPLAYVSAFYEAARLFSADIAVFPCTGKGRVLAGLFSAKNSRSTVTDVYRVESNENSLVARRLVYGGKAEASLELKLPATLCLLHGYYTEAEANFASKIKEVSKQKSTCRVEFKPKNVEGIEPDKSEVVVVAGRGIRTKEDLKMIMELAGILKGAWSVTRPLAVDEGWSETWIGISGLTVSPKLYIGIGVSGQPHHMMGARSSKIIVAINRDRNAPIFEECDYGIVGDLYVVVPEMIKKLKNVK
mgnify:CR=1 FL=1